MNFLILKRVSYGTVAAALTYLCFPLFTVTGRDPRNVTDGRAMHIANAIASYCEQNHRIPATIQDVSRYVSSQSFIDGWGRNFRLELSTPGFSIRSFGKRGVYSEKENLIYSYIVWIDQGQFRALEVGRKNPSHQMILAPDQRPSTGELFLPPGHEQNSVE